MMSVRAESLVPMRNEPDEIQTCSMRFESRRVLPFVGGVELVPYGEVSFLQAKSRNTI
jgi:hypothetical protein